MNTQNKGNRTLFESIMMPEVSKTLRDWSRANKTGVLIGGLALSYYVKPRLTQDVDFLFLSDADLPDAVERFKRIRGHAFQHNVTHVEVELVTPEFVSVPVDIVAKVIATAQTSDGIRVASASGLVAPKLYRLSRMDSADIIALIKTGHVDLAGFDVDEQRMEQFRELVTLAKTDTHPT